MRFFETFTIALNEIKREVKEMGIVVHTKSVQNVNIEENPDYVAMELQNYQYTVTRPDYSKIPVKNLPWCEAEFAERVSGEMLNPGEAWKLREAYWKRFINRFGRFDYAYPCRMTLNLEKVISTLKKDLYSR